MPTYQYKCKFCGHELEEFASIAGPPRVRCPECNTDNLARILGAGGGVIFKGSGFYQTDYKKKQKKPDQKPGEKEQKKTPESGSDTTPDKKPDKT